MDDAMIRRHLTPRHRAALPQMTGQILWRLQNLEWIKTDDEGPCLTHLGTRARTVALSDN